MNTKILVLTLVMLTSCISSYSFAEGPPLTADQIAQMRADRQLVRIAGDPYPPWTEGEAGKIAKSGIAVEIVQELFNRLNLKTLVVVYPFERGIQRIKEGAEDVILMVSKTKKRENFILFTTPIRHSKWVFYHLKKKKFTWNKWKDLRTYRIGYVTGNNVGEDFPAAAKKYKYNIEEVKADNYNAKKLMLGRIDIALTDLEVMQRIIQQNPKYQGKLKWHDKPVFESFYHFGISKKSFLAPMHQRINIEIQKMQEDGTFDKIFCKYKKQYKVICG